MFSLKSKEILVSKLTCRICLGIFRSAMTITECMHTFCQVCLIKRFEEISNDCPICKNDLGGVPMKYAIPNTIIQGIIDIIFPEFTELNKQNSINLYEAFLNNSQSLPGENEVLKDKLKEDKVSIELIPMKVDNKALMLDELEISAIKVVLSCTVKDLQKYIAYKLSIENPDDIVVLFKNQPLKKYDDLLKIRSIHRFNYSINTFHYMRKET